MKEDKLIFSYKDVLNKIKDQENHLLLGNGFNYGLGINTGYNAIFKKMIEKDRDVYKDALTMVKNCCFDLESFVGKLELDIDEDNLFLKKYVRNKVKLDFMKATHEIVKSEIKNIYAEKNEGVFILLKNFNSYFTLNYDSFLYLLLLRYKSIDNYANNAIVFQPNLKFVEDDLDDKQTDIYSEIKTARETGKLSINFGAENSIVEKDFKMLTKTHFVTEIKAYSKAKNNGWKVKDIDRVIKLIIREEHRQAVLDKIDDGSRQLTFDGNNIEFVYDVKSETQNLFFLHGAFHIYKDGDFYKKITQKSDKALYDKLEDVLNNEQQEVVCVFQRKDKTTAIKDNEYLQNCLDKLGKISGNLIVIGSSLADNDNHIFKKINDSEVDTIFISLLVNNKEESYKLAESKFPNKNIYLFDAETISYEIPETIEGDV